MNKNQQAKEHLCKACGLKIAYHRKTTSLTYIALLKRSKHSVIKKTTNRKLAAMTAKDTTEQRYD